ncbi:TrfB-related DNA-binding protein [Janthinobacterium sp. FW305-128]|uniref:TrfB-related DNA-binding protein n=1 Tax=Janthinobacterium sp. FW305-128 TaxID=2775055 RepID=UPI001E30BDCC|nr:TrfB-related DNA-binding protein [Janthinobacterium sp. FW305-128]MCC7684735.1 hypothetical protein [Janthinobacterium sp. FW305-128]
MKKKASQKMTHAEYEEILPLLKNISDERKKAAYARLVDGLTYQSIANQYGWTRQSVYQAAKAVMAKYEVYLEAKASRANSTTLLPVGWERVEVIAPAHLIKKFRAEIAKESPGNPGEEIESKKKPDSK